MALFICFQFLRQTCHFTHDQFHLQSLYSTMQPNCHKVEAYSCLQRLASQENVVLRKLVKVFLSITSPVLQHEPFPAKVNLVRELRAFI